MQKLKLSEIETVSYGTLSRILLPIPFTNYYPLRNRDFCETEDMILFYLLLKQNALRDLLLIGVFLILFSCLYLILNRLHCHVSETHKGLKHVTLICLLCPMLVIIHFRKYHIWNEKKR